MQFRYRQTGNLAFSAPGKANPGPVNCLLASLFVLLIWPAQGLAETGLINRTPVENSGTVKRTHLITPEAEQNELDLIRSNIGALVKSINEIIDTPMDTTPTPIIPETTAEPVTPIVPAQPVVAKPQIKQPEPVIEEATMAMPASNPGATDKSAMHTDATETTVELTRLQHETKDIYLKHDTNGNLLQDDVSEWACVEDTRNGLLWEVKSSNGGIRDTNHSYTWFNPGDKTLQGIPDGGRCEGEIGCDTHAYIEAINQQKLCGYNDWRLPTREEMLSLVDFEQTQDQVHSNTTINPEYFPQTLASWYWTASSNESNPQYAWYVLFRNGISLNDLKERPKHIRLVRGDTNA